MKFPRLRIFFNCVTYGLRRYNSFPMDREISITSEEKPKKIGAQFHDDSPILDPEDDLLGHNALAKSIAKCILNIPKPNGDVIAIHGPWGSGKSSVINLVLHDIKQTETEKERPVIISFNSWCYRSEDGIVAGFFQEFYSGLSSMKGKSKVNAEVLLKLGARLIGPAKLFGLGLELAGMPGASGLISSGSEAIKELISEDEDTEALQRNVEKEIEKTEKRFLIVIDDIDRLSPEEAIAIFRVIKSVGRLKNVTYLLSYDRIITEKMIIDKYPPEGSHYLEKIVQANFDIPDPNQQQLSRILNMKIDKIISNLVTDEYNYMDIHNRIRDIFHEAVIPEIKTPRDVIRLSNMLSVTYPAVKMDVDIADFIALETFRLFRPQLYKEIRSNKLILTRSVESFSKEKFQISSEEIDSIFLSNELERDRARLKSLLARIYPSTGPSFFRSSDRNMHSWNVEKRACSAFHFDTYFRFSASEETVSEFEFQEFIENADDQDFIKQKMLEFLSVKSAYERSKASIMLDMLSRRSESVDNKSVKSLLIAIYSVANELQEKRDNDVEFGYVTDNRKRIKWLSEKLFTMRFTVEDMSSMMREICKYAPLNLRIEYCGVSIDYYYWNEGSEPRQRWVPFTKEDTDDCRIELSREITENIYNYIGEDNFRNVIFNYGNFLQIVSDLHMILNDEDKVETLFQSMLELSEENLFAVAKEFSKVSPKDIFDLIDAEFILCEFHELLGRVSNEEDRNIVRSVISSLEGFKEWRDETQ